MIEFVNRVFTGLVSAGVIVAVLGSLLRRPRRKDLVWLSLGLVGGLAAQAALGGLTVIFELQPPFVMAHFLLSLVLLTNVLVLLRRAGEPEGPSRWRVDSTVRFWDRVLLAAAAVVFIAGTVVTATGPHGGDRSARRFGFDLGTVARIHGASVIVLIATIVILAVLLKRRPMFLPIRAATNTPKALMLIQRRSATQPIVGRLGLVALVVLIQATIGYVQYFTGIPELLVGFHIAGATAVWAAVVWFDLGLRTNDPNEIINFDGDSTANLDAHG